MKRNIALIVPVLTVVALCACSNTAGKTASGPATSTVAQATSSNTETATAEPSEAKETAVISYGTVTKLADYKGIKVDVKNDEITDEDINTIINQIVAQDETREEVSRAAAKGDIVTVDYIATINGEDFDGNTATDIEIRLGVESPLQELYDGIVGMKKGDKKDIPVKLPEDYDEELGGKQAMFSVFAKKVESVTTPELSDEWVSTFTEGQQNSIEEYKDFTRQDVQSYLKYIIREDSIDAIFSDIIENSEFELSEEAVQQEYDSLMEIYDGYASEYGMETEEFITSYVGPLEDVKTDMTNWSKEQVTYKLLEREIKEKEHMTITDEDREEYALINNWTVEEGKAELGEEMFDEYTLRNKISNFLFENADKNIIEERAIEEIM